MLFKYIKVFIRQSVLIITGSLNCKSKCAIQCFKEIMKNYSILSY